MCPAHEVGDGKTHQASLTLKLGDSPGRILLRCAKCGTDRVLDKIGLTFADLNYDETPEPVGPPQVFAYPDAKGKKYLRVTRQRMTVGRPKTCQQHWTGTKWRSGVGKRERVLYNLPRVLNSARKGHTIHLTEGESDAEALNAYFKKHGVKKHFATTHPEGAGKWRGTFAKSLAGSARVVVWADRDTPGYACARQRFLAVQDAGLQVEIRLPIPDHEKADVRDHLEAGHTPDDGKAVRLGDLEELVAEAGHASAATDVLWLSDVTEKPLSWLWSGRVPFGKITILEGDPGLGKSTIWCDVVARVTTGEPFPFDSERRESQSALVVAAEDDLGDTIIPRLRAAGADVSRVATLPLSRGDDGHLIPLALPDDLNRIKSMLLQHKIKLLVIDPIMAFLSEAINSHNDASVRRALTPLAEVLQETGAASLLIRHLNKSGEMAAMYRGGGSIAFMGAARSGLLVAPHPENEDRSVLAQVKTNLSRKVPSLAYRVDKRTNDENLADTYIDWAEEVDLSPDALLGKRDGRRDTSVRDAAAEWLRAFLVDGPQEAQVIKREGDLAGHTWITLKRAKVAISAESIRQRDKTGKTEGWLWSTGPAVELKKVKKSKKRGDSR